MATFNVRDYGALGDGIADDAPAINSALAASVAAGGGKLYIPAANKGKRYKINAPIVIDNSASPARFSDIVNIDGDGPQHSAIDASAITDKALVFKGKPSCQETHWAVRNIGLFGNPTPTIWTRGIRVDVSAYVHMEDVIVEGFYFGLEARDVDQSLFERCNFRWNNAGVVFEAANQVTGPNSLTFVETAICNNYTSGLTINGPNALTFLGGSLQYNGRHHGDLWEYGVRLINGGDGYNTASFVGTVFEGNIGIADLWNDQNGYPFVLNLDGVSFCRSGPTLYAENCVLMSGTAPGHKLRTTACSFGGFNGYVPSAARKYIKITNGNAAHITDGSNIYRASVEA